MKKNDLANDLKNLLKEYSLDLNSTNTSRFVEDAISLAEEYMVPKPVRKLLDTPDGDIPVIVAEWE